jgi:HEPN domain-containing protein
MKSRPETLEQVSRWVKSAEDDLLTARNMLALGKKCPCAVVAFHSQQCAEKYIKAFLTLRSVEFPKTHDLIQLLRLIPRSISKKPDLSEAAFLSRFAVETRYPGNHEPFTVSEARKALRHRLPKGALGSRPSEEE